MTLQELYQYLRTKDLYPDLSELDNGVIIARIDWGDWKHEHRYLDVVMSELGYTLIGVEITEEDGSDCYSADHYYKKMGVM